jgi:hypothetical protein
MTNDMEGFLREGKRQSWIKFSAWLIVVIFVTAFILGAIFIIIDSIVKVAFGV